MFGQKVGRHYPGQMGEAAKVADDGRQGRRDDGLVERREQQRQKKCAENRDNRRSVLS